MHHSQLLLLSSFLAVNVAALPLNINLGAYSPALVVGDGEISFGGKQDVSDLMNALEGAAVSGAAANGAANAAPAAASAAPASSAAAVSVVPTDQGNTQITTLQGMGKEIAPRIVPFVKSEKRDINGFNAALKFAADALKNSPKIQLGTGSEGSGVGILQDAGINAPAAAKARDEKEGKRREVGEVKGRDVQVDAVEKKLRTTVTTMFVRRGPALDPAESNLEDASAAPSEKRAPPSTLDGVNLNMADGQIAELTFIETRAVGEGDDE